MNNRVEMLRRWQRIIRQKATYDHDARAKGKIVTQPDLDEIANEMEAFIAGYYEEELILITAKSRERNNERQRRNTQRKTG